MFLRTIKLTCMTFLVGFLLSSVAMAATDVLWTEDFQTSSHQDKAGATAGIFWVADQTGITGGSRFQVEESSGNFFMEGKGTSVEAMWTAEDIPISGYIDVGISVDFSSGSGTHGAVDYIELWYSLNDGNGFKHALSNWRFEDGFSPVTASVSGLSGNLLDIQIRLMNDNSSERLRFDNVKVTAETVPIPTALLLFGSGLVGLVGFKRKKALQE